ncbi:MAG: hypothetical protein C4290_12000 [Chloroflexota bacterium]
MTGHHQPLGEHDPLGQAIAAAIEAFDAGNHAWGRYLHYVLRPYRSEHPEAPSPVRVRAALREAALSVPHSREREELRAFYNALLLARRALRDFIAALPDPLRTADLLMAPDAFAEAMTYLEPWIGDDLR